LSTINHLGHSPSDPARVQVAEYVTDDLIGDRDAHRRTEPDLPWQAVTRRAELTP